MAKHNLAGAEAEDKVCKYLVKNGYKVLDQNWKTKFCEIDIVAQKKKTIFFVEVKYRATDRQGGGFEVVDSAKLRQMERGAEAWVTQNDWEGQYTLSVAQVSGEQFVVSFIEDIYS